MLLKEKTVKKNLYFTIVVILITGSNFNIMFVMIVTI